MRPGINFAVQPQLPPTTPPSNTGAWFVAGIASQGPTAAKSATSFAAWQAIYGQRGSNPLLSDSVETYFNEGGSQVVTARVVGPGAVAASKALLDGSAPAPLASITVAAIGPGAYANGYQAVIANGTTLTAPSAPVPTTAATGGTIAAGTYTVAVTYVNNYGETVASANGTVITTGTTSTITIPSPVASGSATGWYAYVSQAGGSTLTRQQAAGSPTAIGTSLTLTAPPTSSGVQPSTNNTSGGYTITINDANGNLLETSNLLATPTDAVNYSQTSSYVTVTSQGTNAPAPGTFTLAGGLDDTANITTTQWTNAFTNFTLDLGPGQVSAPGQTTTAIQTAVVNHANAFNRVAYLDAPDTPTAATITSNVASITALTLNYARRAAMFAPWADIAPAIGTSGTRAVPPSAFAAGRAAFNDAATLNPNIPAAGIRGIIWTPVQLHALFTDADRQTLNTAGVNVIRKMAGNSFRIYGNVTCVNRIADPLYYQLSNVRLDMAIQDAANTIAENFMFSQIDGAGQDAADFGNELVSMMTGWLTLKALFIGANGTPAFIVDTSATVNTPTTAAAGQLLATIAYVRSPGAEQVNFNIMRGSVALGI